MMDLLLFATVPELVRVADAAGVRGVVADLEVRDKSRRQRGFDTQISADVPDDLRSIRSQTPLPIICRINPVGDWTPCEIEAVLDAGADEILVPMVRTVAELEQVVDLVRGRCQVGTMVETEQAVVRVRALARLPIRRMYVGLNDLRIERGSPHIFTAIADGTVDRIRQEAGDVAFGVAGLTLPEAGAPLPCRYLIDELTRLGCDFTFLRRSFFRDIDGRDPLVEIPRILQAVARSRRRSPDQVVRDRAVTLSAIKELPGQPWQTNEVAASLS